jgi:alpha-L-arabinofuranosidase
MSYMRFTVNFHDYDWTNMVGDVTQRTVKFGIPEFLSYAKEVGAEPVIMISDYHGASQDAAALVKYLNAQGDADGDGVDWAAVRDSDKALLGLEPGP